VRRNRWHGFALLRLLYHGLEGITIGEKKERPQERFDKANSKRIVIKVMTRTESDILDQLESEPNKAGYIKRLIREDIARKKQANRD